ncbi:hypothetical protein QQ045_030619 [Rhodiola kirilowii]
MCCFRLWILELSASVFMTPLCGVGVFGAGGLLGYGVWSGAGLRGGGVGMEGRGQYIFLCIVFSLLLRCWWAVGGSSDGVGGCCVGWVRRGVATADAWPDILELLPAG